jgi:threonine dehydrogenase-like Zn-dependent dehydrogenase
VRGYRLRALAPPALEPIELAAPSLRDDDVAIEVEAAWLPLDPIGERVSGAAAVGRVVAAGDRAGHLIGQRVLCCSALPCGECEVCRRGGGAACPTGGTLGRDRDGALAEQVVARGRWVCPLGDALPLSPLAGALVAGPAALAYAMYARANLSPGQPVVAIGRGPVAALVARVATARGGRPVVTAPDGDPTAIGAELAALAPGDGRPRMIFDAGEPGGLALAAALAQPASTLIALARPGAAPLDVAPLLARHVALIGVAGPHPDLLPELAALAVRGELPLDGLASEVAWSGLPALEAPAAGRAVIVLR